MSEGPTSPPSLSEHQSPAGGPSRPRGSLSLTAVCQVWGQGYAGSGGGQTQLGVPGHSWAGSRLLMQQLLPSGPAPRAPPRGGQQPAWGRNAGMQWGGRGGHAWARQAQSLPSCAEARGPGRGSLAIRAPDSHLGMEPEHRWEGRRLCPGEELGLGLGAGSFHGPRPCPAGRLQGARAGVAAPASISPSEEEPVRDTPPPNSI